MTVTKSKEIISEEKQIDTDQAELNKPKGMYPLLYWPILLKYALEWMFNFNGIDSLFFFSICNANF